MHTYIHTYIHAYIHTYIHTYMLLNRKEVRHRERIFKGRTYLFTTKCCTVIPVCLESVYKIMCDFRYDMHFNSNTIFILCSLGKIKPS